MMLIGIAAQRPQGVLVAPPPARRSGFFAAEHRHGRVRSPRTASGSDKVGNRGFWPAMVTPRSATSVKSGTVPSGLADAPGERSPAIRAVHRARWSNAARRGPAAFRRPGSGCRRQSSSKTAIISSPGVAFNIGTTSLVPDIGEGIGSASSSTRHWEAGDPLQCGRRRPRRIWPSRRQSPANGCDASSWVRPHLTISDVSAKVLQKVGPLDREGRRCLIQPPLPPDEVTCSVSALPRGFLRSATPFLRNPRGGTFSS